ncbi:hypothetical protein DEF23_25560 [Marinitenerispora sediminis]|uniref:Uncharacterized protein n=1 Tax=Marinitenerispora sediminis TaxID=1931232 RepID=A0A368T122_9ACTN|nr:hypothetical protein DEF23_25560 [Marinitenerispora sediminis]RCV52157.1 hypothetical protein DEF28_13670 [Marinitenerispora sediminis]RCV53154.1 hypothetical protein DEF24_21020 [Marinitenerispora sediminis]
MESRGMDSPRGTAPGALGTTPGAAPPREAGPVSGPGTPASTTGRPADVRSRARSSGRGDRDDGGRPTRPPGSVHVRRPGRGRSPSAPHSPGPFDARRVGAPRSASPPLAAPPYAATITRPGLDVLAAAAEQNGTPACGRVR